MKSRFIFEFWLREAEGVIAPQYAEFWEGSRHGAAAQARALNQDTHRSHNVTFKWVSYI